MPLIIGVAGGTGSGKTTVMQAIARDLGRDQVSVIQHDSYYRDRSDIPPANRERINFDHPDSLDTALLVEHVRALRAGRAVEIPVYDFATHTRTGRTTTVESRPVVIIEGILILADPALRHLLDITVFVDTDPDIRLIRRIRRDVSERARTWESVVEQYVDTVRPMHLEFVEPSKRHAQMIITEGGHNDAAVEMVITKIRSMVNARTDST